MIIEHVFVTTLDGPTTIERIRRFLGVGGFYLTTSSPPELREWAGLPGGPSSSAPLKLRMRRGEDKAKQALNVAALPQEAAVEFDRGRVTLAIDITPSPVWGGAGVFNAEGSESKMQLHQTMLHAIAVGIELVAAHDRSEAEAAAPWREAERCIFEAAAARTRRRRITVGFLLVFIAAIIGLIIWSANSSNCRLSPPMITEEKS
ncbi:MAG: hypothetical protein QM775_26660 [Pirellulales bacterium]